ncbi:MAG: hypothetical protein U0414_19835 [Polyangiaceae bacterium]
MSAKRVRIQDPALGDAARRRQEYCRTLSRRLDEVAHGSTRVDRSIALMEAEVAAKLVESATYEITIRLIQNGISSDAERDLAKLLRPYKEAVAHHAMSDGEIIRA